MSIVEDIYETILWIKDCSEGFNLLSVAILVSLSIASRYFLNSDIKVPKIWVKFK